MENRPTSANSFQCWDTSSVFLLHDAENQHHQMGDYAASWQRANTSTQYDKEQRTATA